MEGFSSNLNDTFTSTRGCAEPMFFPQHILPLLTLYNAQWWGYESLTAIVLVKIELLWCAKIQETDTSTVPYFSSWQILHLILVFLVFVSGIWYEILYAISRLAIVSNVSRLIITCQCKNIPYSVDLKIVPGASLLSAQHIRICMASIFF